jgi:hypothetical protein
MKLLVSILAFSIALSSQAADILHNGDIIFTQRVDGVNTFKTISPSANQLFGTSSAGAVAKIPQSAFALNSSLAAIAKSGLYSDLSGLPGLPNIISVNTRGDGITADIYGDQEQVFSNEHGFFFNNGGQAYRAGRADFAIYAYPEQDFNNFFHAYGNNIKVSLNDATGAASFANGAFAINGDGDVTEGQWLASTISYDKLDLPPQTGNAGKVLTTDGSTTSWGTAASGLSTPRIVYVEHNGNDSTAEIGNPAKPFGTVQAGFEAALTLDSNPVILHIGVFEDNTGPINYTGDWPSNIILAGYGKVGDINLVGANGSAAQDAIPAMQAIVSVGPFNTDSFPDQSITFTSIFGSQTYAWGSASGDFHLDSSTPENNAYTLFAAIAAHGGTIQIEAGYVAEGETSATVRSSSSGAAYTLAYTATGSAGSGNASGSDQIGTNIPAGDGQSIYATIKTDGIVQVGTIYLQGGMGGSGSASQPNGYAGAAYATLENVQSYGSIYIIGGNGGNNPDAPGGYNPDGDGVLTITNCLAYYYYGTLSVNHVCTDGWIAAGNANNYYYSGNSAPSTNRFRPD